MFVETFSAALLIGGMFGFLVSGVLVVDPLRRSRNVLRDRVIAEQMRTYAAQARLDAFRLMSQRERAENSWHSRKATLEVVR